MGKAGAEQKSISEFIDFFKGRRCLEPKGRLPAGKVPTGFSRVPLVGARAEPFHNQDQVQHGHLVVTVDIGDETVQMPLFDRELDIGHIDGVIAVEIAGTQAVTGAQGRKIRFEKVGR